MSEVNQAFLRAYLKNRASQPSAPTLTESLMVSADKKTATVSPEKIGQLFYHDCSASDVAFAQAHLGAQSMACLATPVNLTDAHYGAIPKVYILCTQAKDLDKSPLVQNVPCQKVYKLASSHSPFFSMPEHLAAIVSS